MTDDVRTIFAVRQTDRWVFFASDRDTESDVSSVLDDLGLEHREIRYVGTYGEAYAFPAANRIVAEDDVYPEWVSEVAPDWFFDPVSRRWLAPEDGPALGRIPSDPQSGLLVEFGAERVGWLPVTLTAGNHRLEFKFSNVGDPFKHLAQWLEALLDGPARFILEIEGAMLECHTFPSSPDRVRLYALYYGFNETPADCSRLDVDLPRLAIVRGFYAAILNYWNQEDVPGNWIDGTRGPYPANYDDRNFDHYFFPVRSKRIEDALGIAETENET